MDAIEKEFEWNPLDTFVVPLAVDATQQTSTLNVISFIDSLNCTIDLESVGVIAVVLLVISGSSASGRVRYEPPERVSVG